MTEIVRADALAGFSALVAEYGGEPGDLLAGVGLSAGDLADGDAYISFRSLLILLERTATELRRPDFGLRYGSATIDNFGPLSVAIRNAESVRAGFELGRRYMHFHNPSVELILRQIDDETFVGLGLRLRRPPRHLQAMERGVATLHQVITLMGGPYRPREICFSHQHCAPLAIYREVFGVTPTFGAQDNGLVVSNDTLSRIQPARNPHLHQLAERFLKITLPAPGANIAPRARFLVERLLRDGGCEQIDLARALGLHERTLQRRLKAEQVTFEELRDEVRRDIARQYLAQPKVPIGHIAEMLGYAEASAFSRSCRRWFGASPRAMRRALSQHAA